MTFSFFPVGDVLWREGNEGRTVPPRSINPAYGPEQKRLKQYTMIPCKTIADAMINNVLLNTKNLVIFIRWLGLLTCKTVSQLTYTVLLETLNPAQSIIIFQGLRL